jgi:uncharacterized damage-inducible protein DinB
MAMENQNPQLKAFIERLREEVNQTLDALIDLPQDYLNAPCGHACARGGSVRDLLVHNIFHERQHTGQVWSIRDQLEILQGWDRQDLPMLLDDYTMARAQLIASLFGLRDAQLDIKPPDGGWTVRETLEHVLYWDRDSIDTLQTELAGVGQKEP